MRLIAPMRLLARMTTPMKHRHAFLVFTVILLVAGAAARPATAIGPKPNVLFIAIDDLSHWVGYLGRNPQAITPNLDRLARRGVWFTRSYCPAPVCNASRAALMSGLRPGATGVYDNKEDFRPAIPEALTLTTQFRRAGYHVCGAGKIYHSSIFRDGEWDDWLGRGGPPRGEEGPGRPGRVRAGGFDITPLDCRDEDMLDAKSVAYAVEQLGRRHDRPFFIACGLSKPHLPWSVPATYYDRFPVDGILLPPFREDDLDDLPAAARALAIKSGDHQAILDQDGIATWRQAIRAYLAAISFCDAMVGRLLDAYDASPERSSTIICLWSDHGWHLGEKQHWRKFTLWEESARAPLIWVVPGLTPADGRCDRTIDHMSIYPTLMDLCGLPTPPHVQAQSIRRLLADPQAPWVTPAITTYRRHNHSIRSEAFRYTRYEDGGEEFYDEVRDPYEWTNLASEGVDEPRGIAELRRWLPAENVPAVDAGQAADWK
jgi:arylsulfatase A-like enzyme